MKRRSLWRLAGTGMLALLVLAGLLLLLANLYVQSHGVQARLQAELGSALRMPVDIRKTTFTPWEGFRIDGIQADSAEGGGKVQLSADSFRARLAFWPLIRERRVEVSDVLFDRPALAWTQTGNGRWRWPGARPEPSPVESPVAPAVAAPATDPALSPNPSPDGPAAPSGPIPPGKAARRANRLAVDIRDIRVRHGHLELKNHRGTVVARCEEVNADGVMAPAADQGSGTVWMKRVAFGPKHGPGAEGLSLDDLHSPFTYDDETLRLDGGRARLAAGEVRLDGNLHPREPGTPFAVRGGLTNVSLAALLNRVGLNFDLAAGQVAGEFDLAGLAGEQSSQVGKGQIRITGGELHGVPEFASLGIEELSRLKVEEARADLVLNGANLRVEPVILASRNLRLQATGDVHLDRGGSPDPTALDFQARIILGRSITRQLPALVGNNFLPVPDSAEGERYLDFHVGGPLNSPSTDLREKIFGKVSLREVLEDFFGGDKPKDKKKKPR